ncbi:MAG: InlB B-repeat-containing protein, partial [Eubacterium sp.]|nr:InlB B-repeat-containing protein [Eubacterium sp.]
MKFNRFRLLAAVLAGTLITSNIAADFLVVPVRADDGEVTTEAPAPAESQPETTPAEAPVEAPAADVSSNNIEEAAASTDQVSIPSGDLVTDGTGAVEGTEAVVTDPAATAPAATTDPAQVIPEGQTTEGETIVDPALDPTADPEAVEDPAEEKSEEVKPAETITITFNAGEGGLVAYDGADGQSTLSQTVSSPDAIQAVNAIALDGYEFAGWEGIDLDSQRLDAANIPYASATYVAHFRMSEQKEEVKEPEYWIVSYYESEDAAEAFTTKQYEKKEGQTLGELPTAPDKEGTVFKNWITSDTSEVVTESTSVSSDMKIVAVYEEEKTEEAEPEVVLHTVVFYGADQEELTRREVEDGKTIGALPEAPEKEDLTFVEWTDSEGNTVTAETAVTSDLNVQAQYEPAKSIKAIKKAKSADEWAVNFRNRDGDIIQTINVTKGDAIGTLPGTGSVDR